MMLQGSIMLQNFKRSKKSRIRNQDKRGMPVVYFMLIPFLIPDSYPLDSCFFSHLQKNPAAYGKVSS